MSLLELITKLNQANIKLSLVNGQIKFDDIINNGELYESVKFYERDLIEFLEGSESGKSESIEKAPHSELHELSYAQRRLWILDQMEDAGTTYNIPMAFEIRGNLDFESFEKSFNYLVNRHESLRTTIVIQNGQPRQKIKELKDSGFEVYYNDLRGESVNNALVLKYIDEEKNRKFNLSEGPLIRAVMLHVDDDHYIFLLTLHHVISDGWSVEVLIREFLFLYNGFKEGVDVHLPALSIQYKDYAYWQRKMLSGVSLKRYSDFWTNEFSGKLPVLDLPIDNIRPPVMTHSGEVVNIKLNRVALNNLYMLGNAYRCSLFMTLQALLNVLFYKYTEQEDIIVGFPIAGRDHDELEGQIGFYVNTLALRTKFNSSDTFVDLMQKVRVNILNAYDHSIYPFDRLIDELDIPRDVSRSALFDIMVEFQENSFVSDGQSADLEGLSIKGYDNDFKVAKFDLSFSFTELVDGLDLAITYNKDLFDQVRINNMAAHFKQICNAVLKAPELPIAQIQYLSIDELNQLDDTSRVEQKQTDFSVIALFNDLVLKSADSPALVNGDQVITYKQLDELSDRIAISLITKYEVVAEDLVGILLESTLTVEFILSSLAIIKAGCKYIRIEHDEHLASCKALIYNSKSDTNQIGDFNIALNLDLELESLSNCELDSIEITGDKEVLYTVLVNGEFAEVRQSDVINYSIWLKENFSLNSLSRAAIFWSLDSHFIHMDIFGLLLSGVPIHLNNAKEAIDVGAFMQANDISHVLLPALLCEEIINLPNAYHLKDVEFIVSGHRSLRYSSAFNITRLFHYDLNSKVFSYDDAVKVDDTNSLGKVLPYLQAAVLDEHGMLVPRGVVGRINVTENYHGFSQKKTGLYGYWTQNGSLTGLSDKRRGVEISGFPVNTLEVESILLKHTDIRSIVVKKSKNLKGEDILVAFYLAKSNLEENQLISFFASQMPDYMLPKQFVQLEALPYDYRGNVITDVLVSKISSDSKSSKDEVLSEIEIQLLDIWKDVLGNNDIGVSDNFFKVAGNSIKATQIVSRMYKLGYKVSLRSIFGYPTVRELAGLLSVMSNTEA